MVRHFPGRFLLAASLRRRKMSVYSSVFTVEIPVNYARELWELFEAATYICVHKLNLIEICSVISETKHTF